MTVRNLGDWSPLDLGSDPVHADPEEVSDAQVQYQKISDTLTDAIAKLQKIVDQGSDSLAGKYVEKLKSDASSVKDNLTKVSRRYADVADQIKKYQPHLDDGLRDTATALSEARDAQADHTKANALPDGQKGSDGSLSPDEQQKQDAKNKAAGEADDRMSAAKNRLNNAMNALDAAGKAFGDAVNCKNYDDGLSDSAKDRILAKLGEIFGIIGMILGVLAILIPGVDLIAIAGVAASVVSLVANSMLYADGFGSLLDVVLSAVGVGLAAGGLLVSAVGKNMANIAKGIWTGDRPPSGIELDNLGGQTSVLGDGELATIGPWDAMPEAFANLPKGFFATEWYNLKNAWQMYKQLGGGLPGIQNFLKDIGLSIVGFKTVNDFNAIMKLANFDIGKAWYIWGGGNAIFNLGAIIIAGGQAKQWFPAVNPPSYYYS